MKLSIIVIVIVRVIIMILGKHARQAIDAYIMTQDTSVSCSLLAYK